MSSASETKGHRINMGLAGVHGFLIGLAVGARARGVDFAHTREAFNNLCALAREVIPATGRHDAGAYARCSFCGRYTIHLQALEKRRVPLCECGRKGGWSGSFKRPAEDAQWSFSLDKEDDVG
jgi:hypothetical protein